MKKDSIIQEDEKQKVEILGALFMIKYTLVNLPER